MNTTVFVSFANFSSCSCSQADSTMFFGTCWQVISLLPSMSGKGINLRNRRLVDHIKYSRARSRSSRVPANKTISPTDSTRHSDAPANISALVRVSSETSKSPRRRIHSTASPVWLLLLSSMHLHAFSTVAISLISAFNLARGFPKIAKSHQGPPCKWDGIAPKAFSPPAVDCSLSQNTKDLELLMRADSLAMPLPNTSGTSVFGTPKIRDSPTKLGGSSFSC
mmetsp:Transcript_105248/g.182675  ORF Transcript_105248/g.182675 Transcript_105248/m.182675 type:complete len:223 (+) Transcript_105248:722-1390(+)